MFNRNSIFFRVLAPVIVVMLLQISLISMVLFANGTISSLGDSAIEALRQNTENRAITLENMMIYYWSNLDRFEAEVAAEIDRYLEENGITLEQLSGDYDHEVALLNNISDPLISALRQTTATGAFIYFVNREIPENGSITCNGLFYRDLDPMTTPADYSDIQYLRGYIDIARKDRIQLDSLWSEVFVFSSDEASSWHDYPMLYRAWSTYTGIKPADLAYWSEPRLVAPDTPLDARRHITYTRPFYYDGKLVAMIGTEVQTNQLEKYFPMNDYDSSGKSGYILLKYDATDTAEDGIACEPCVMTGSYIKRLLGSKESFMLLPAQRDGVFYIGDENIEGVQIVMRPMRLYNTNAPFSNEGWALTAIGTDSLLFESATNVSRGILYSSSVALVVGTIILAVIIRLSTRPLISMATQIERGDPDDPVVVSNSSTYEIMLLSSTINAMKDKRRYAEAQLREERERYLIALESTDDTFMEYDLSQDVFTLYYFDGSGGDPELSTRTTPGFWKQLNSGEFCHTDDIADMRAYILSKTAESVAARIRADYFPHISGIEQDGEFYWFLFKTSRILDERGELLKIIGTAREITAQKLEEFRRIETLRRDPTTGFYNREFGMQLLEDAAERDDREGRPYAVCCILAEGYELFEAYYGRVFAASIFMEISRLIEQVTGEDDIIVRYANDECFLLLRGTDRNEVRERLVRLFRAATAVYAGENAELKLGFSTGIALPEYGKTAVNEAQRAARYSKKTGGNRYTFCDEMPESAVPSEEVYPEKPIAVSLDVNRQTAVSFAFELFERTSDVHSAVNMMMYILGDMYNLRQIAVCNYDSDFGANNVSYQWSQPGIKQLPTAIEKIKHRDMLELEMMLDADGALLYTAETLEGCSDEVRRLLCAPESGDYSAYCCIMYENETQTGRIVFICCDNDREWEKTEILSLYEISKIVAAHLSIEKSNSASRAKSEFLSRISHEIRTPMNAITGMVEIAKNSTDNPERLSDSLAKIDFSAKHLLSLINDVLEVSRIESGKLQIEYSSFSLRGFTNGIETLMRPPIEAKDIAFRIVNNTVHDEVFGDEYRLRQVIVNFLGNANKFTDPGGEIVFTIEETDSPPPHLVLTEDDGEVGFYRFSVRDNGVGISVEDQPLIFRAFEQARDSEASKKQQGTGLGLTISTSIVSAMGSKIELTSNAGEGSDFYFTLKMKLGEERDGVEHAPEESVDFTGLFAGKRALLAEDNEINIEIALYILGETGLTIDVARNGEDAVNAFFESEPDYYDIILMDIQMPVMDGLTAARNIRKNTARPDARTVPIIAMTANAFDEDMKKSVESGMNGHIAKPIDTNALYSLLRKLLAEVK